MACTRFLVDGLLPSMSGHDTLRGRWVGLALRGLRRQLRALVEGRDVLSGGIAGLATPTPGLHTDQSQEKYVQTQESPVLDSVQGAEQNKKSQISVKRSPAAMVTAAQAASGEKHIR